MTDDEFWSATDQLKLIHQWARASYVAPWALLLAVLLRVAASTGPRVMLPGPPAPASLNMGVVLLGRSGAGKGVTDKISRVVWPADIHEEGAGSGQGIHELFKEQKNPEDRITSALITVSEIDHLAALNAGQGNNTRATLKAALTGDRLGSKGASSATTRSVPADSYRLCMSLSAQYGHTAVLMDDVSGGMPQRLLWGLVTDPDMPEEPGPAPDRVLDTALPTWAQSDRQTLIQYGPDEIRDYIHAGLLANGRGDGEALDGHRTLTRLKVAAQLAILDHRSVISSLDWELSEHIMAKSDATRASVLDHDRQAARAKVRDRAVSRAAGEDFYDASRLETVKRSILRMLERDGEQAGNVLRSRLGRKEKRELFDQAIALLEADGLVSPAPGLQKGARYRIGGQGDHDGQGAYQQVTRPDQVGQGDHSATVTDLETRRSPDPATEKLTCQQWFNNWIAGLQSQGYTTTTSLAATEAGMAEGYTKGNIRQASSAHPEVHSLGRSGGTAQWSIAPGARPRPPKPAPEWLDEWLDAQTERTVSPSDARDAGQLAGHPWDNVRKAAGQSPRIRSIPAQGDARNDRIWLIVQAEENAG